MVSSSQVPVRKAKVSLNDYPFRRDVEVRLFLAHLSAIEVDVLREIIHHSLKISVEQLAEDVGVEIDVLLPVLDKLNATKLFKRQHMTLIVDKEVRKYFETKIEKFDDDFNPDVDFLQSLLSKVPIHILPLWYAIPRSSDNIFESIVEKNFLTPKMFRQYLSELQFDNPIFKSIIQEVNCPPHFMVTVSDLMKKFNLTHECVEEYLLTLEYHFVCCLSYRQIEGQWQEVVTPFAEWREFLKFEYDSILRPLPEESIAKHQTVEFSFIKDLVTVLQACQSKKILLKSIKDLYTVDLNQEILINKLVQLNFVKKNGNNQLSATPKGIDWLSMPLYEQVAALANDPLNTLTEHEEFSSLWNVRNLRLIEKCLRRLKPKDWVKFESFLQGMAVPIGDKEAVTLKNKGKKWRYARPVYSDQEKQFIQTVIMERLMELGIVETGSYENKPCFCLTPFGYQVTH